MVALPAGCSQGRTHRGELVDQALPEARSKDNRTVPALLNCTKHLPLLWFEGGMPEEEVGRVDGLGERTFFGLGGQEAS